MTLGDILTFISVLIAIIGFAYNSSKRIVFYKLTQCHIVFTLLYIAFVSYLLMFDLAVDYNFYCDIFCFNPGFPTPDQWAYIISILFVIYWIWKLFIDKEIPQENYEKVIGYYEELIHSDLPLLVYNIKTYNLDDLLKHIENLNNDKDYTYCNSRFSVLLCEHIIFNKSFINGCIKRQYSDFYLGIITRFKNYGVCGLKESAGYFYKVLIEECDSYMAEALQNTNNFRKEPDYIDCFYRLDEFQFSNKTFTNIHFINKLDILKEIGEAAIRDTSTNPIYTAKWNEYLKEQYKYASAHLYLLFFDIYARECIYAHVMSTDDKQKNGQNRKSDKPNKPDIPLYTEYLNICCENVMERVNDLSGTIAETFVNDTYNKVLSLIKLGKETNCDLYHYQLKNLKDFLKRSKHAFKEAVNCLGAEERKEWEKDELSLLKED